MFSFKKEPYSKNASKTYLFKRRLFLFLILFFSTNAFSLEPVRLDMSALHGVNTFPDGVFFVKDSAQIYTLKEDVLTLFSLEPLKKLKSFSLPSSFLNSEEKVTGIWMTDDKSMLIVSYLKSLKVLRLHEKKAELINSIQFNHGQTALLDNGKLLSASDADLTVLSVPELKAIYQQPWPFELNAFSFGEPRFDNFVALNNRDLAYFTGTGRHQFILINRNNYKVRMLVYYGVANNEPSATVIPTEHNTLLVERAVRLMRYIGNSKDKKEFYRSQNIEIDLNTYQYKEIDNEKELSDTGMSNPNIIFSASRPDVTWDNNKQHILKKYRWNTIAFLRTRTPHLKHGVVTEGFFMPIKDGLILRRLDGHGGGARLSSPELARFIQVKMSDGSIEPLSPKWYEQFVHVNYSI